jgi:hypothetical protein
MKLNSKFPAEQNSYEYILFGDPICLNGLFPGYHRNVPIESVHIQIGSGDLPWEASRDPVRSANRDVCRQVSSERS